MFLSSNEDDTGKSHIRIARSEMDRLGIGDGDIVKIIGQKTVAAICLPYVESSNTAKKPQITLLKNSNNIPDMMVSTAVFSSLQVFSGVGSQVKLEKMDSSLDSFSATKVILAKLPDHIKILGSDYETRLDFEKLRGRLVSKNEPIVIQSVGQNPRQEFSSIILDVEPDSQHHIWMITGNTKFELQNATTDVFLKNRPQNSGFKNLLRVIPIAKQIQIDEDITITIPSLEIYENGSKLLINLTERLHKIEEAETFDYHAKKYVKVKQPVQKLQGFPRFNIALYDESGNTYFCIQMGGMGSGSAFPSNDPNWEFYLTNQTAISLQPLVDSKELRVVITDVICESVQMQPVVTEPGQPSQDPHKMTLADQGSVRLVIASGPWEFKINLK